MASDECFCCCACVTTTMAVAYEPDAYRPAEEYEVGDLVYVAADPSLDRWEQQRVVWSAGAGGAGATLLRVVHGESDVADSLVVTRTQLFLTAERRLKPAAALVPGEDALVDAAGSPRAVLALEAGTFEHGLHHLATSAGPATSPNGHLLLANGVVCADWALQVGLSSNPERLALVDGYEDLPELGTDAYRQAHPQLEHTDFGSAVAGLATEGGRGPSGFQAHASPSGIEVPAGAPSFITPDQAQEIRSRRPQLPPTSDVANDVVGPVFRQFRGAYPDVTFRLNAFDSLPNAYSLRNGDGWTIVVSGGLVRTEGVSQHGLAAALAHSIGVFNGGPPRAPAGTSCVGQADYAIAPVLLYVYPGLTGTPVIDGGIAEIATLFAAVELARGGSDPCTDPTLDCRIDAMQAGFALDQLPECAGGGLAPTLEVTDATGSERLPHGEVTVAFNEAVDPATAEQVGNYSFDPMTRVESAAVSRTDPAKVVLSADVRGEVDYRLTVLRVLSAQKAPLVPGRATAEFRGSGLGTGPQGR
ncbi:MAG TPA: hypothetical protein VF533_19925 [Solirubrobacteraceae bacterium]